MASIRLNGLPQKQTVKNKEFLYSDLHLDLESGYISGKRLFQKPESGDIKLDYDGEAIRNSLATLFTTTPGQKILNPEYGLDLKRYIFSPATEQTAIEIKREIYTQIAAYEPRVNITNVKITILEDVNEYDIDITYEIPSLNINSFKIFGTLTKEGVTNIS